MPIQTQLLKWLIVGLAVVAGSLACTERRGPATTDSGWMSVLEDLEQGISDTSRYPRGSIEVLASPVHVHVRLSDGRLARADEATQERAARDVVTGVAQVSAAREQLHRVNEVSVAIVHPEGASGLLWSTHTEEVYYFRRGSDQRFHAE